VRDWRSLETAQRSDRGTSWLLVHRVVLSAFVGPPPDGCEAAHQNGNRQDNRVENLAWKTHQENIDDRAAHGRTARGERAGPAKLTEAQAREILRLARERVPQREIAHRFGLVKGAVSHIVTGRNWAHLPR
jgi:hypothetical protein